MTPRTPTPFPPPGLVTRDEACRMLRLSDRAWKHWCKDGRVRSGRWVVKPTGGRCKVYALKEVERLVAGQGEDAADPLFLVPDGHGGYAPPAGFIERRAAARMFGVSIAKWDVWQNDGRVDCGRWARRPTGMKRRRRVYPLDALKRLLDELDRVGRPYPDPERPGCWRVPVMAHETTRCEAIVDAESMPLLEGMGWNWAPPCDVHNGCVIRSAPSGGQTPMQRIVLGLSGPYWRIRHANGNPLDCRRANLVVRTINEQTYGSRKRKSTAGRPCTSRYKGVWWVERRHGWMAGIQKDGVGRRLGVFRDEVAAAQAYDEAARELFGAHARLNFPDGVDAALAADAEADADAARRHPAPAGRSGKNAAGAAGGTGRRRGGSD